MTRSSKTFIIYLFLLSSSLVFIACDNENFGPAINNEEPVKEFLTTDTGLRITLLTDDDDNETYYFDSYLFVFHTDDTVTATNSSETVQGTYSVFIDDGQLELQMSFPNNTNFIELNDDWYFISIDQDKIRFDDSGDRLEFQQQ